jgi:putative transposase
LFEAFGAYGYRRIHAELVRGDERVGPELVRRLMRELGLVPVQPRPFRATTVPDPDAPTPSTWSGAILRRPARDQGRRRRHLYPEVAGLAVFGNADRLFQQRGIGWSMADKLRTELVTDAMDMAVRNQRLEPYCVMHPTAVRNTR